MKKLYVIGALASLYLAPTVNAQNAKVVVADPMQTIALPAERHTVDVDYNTVSNRETVFCNDFSDASDWAIDTEEQGTWEWVTETPAQVDQYMGAMASATADNGFCVFNGIQWLFNPPVLTQESTITYVGDDVIDCSTLSDVIVTFNQRYRAFNVDQTFVEISNNGGADWESYQINEDEVTNEPAIQGEISVNISAVAAGQSDVMVRFYWRSDYIADNPDATQEDMNNFGSGYGWMVDDICISSPPENEIVIGTTWYQNFFEIQEQAAYLDVDLINAAEYNRVPFHSLRPFNFACIVKNEGSMDQTNVKLVVTVTDADGNPNVEAIESPDGYTLPAGATDTLRIYDVMPDNWVSTTTPGTFTIDFEVVQDQEDELPGNNIGVSLFTRVSDDNFTGPINGGGAVESHSNSNTVTPNTTTWNLEDDAIHANRYTFDESDVDRVIVAIQFALKSDTEPGEEILFNLRQGSVTEEESAENVMDLFFSYDDADMPYITNEADFTDDSNPVWITQELPNAVLIEPNTIYQPEIMLPVVGQPYCVLAATSGRTSTIGVFYYFPEPAAEGQGWYAWSTVEYCLRLVTAPLNPIGVEDVTFESGIKLTQNYPNPFNDVTRIQYQFDETTTAALEVYDMSGKLVFADDLGVVAQNTANSYMFNKGSLSAGMYTYSIVTENNRITRKMTIE